MWHTDNLGEPITKVNFASVLDMALKKSIKPETLINGFRTCGMVLFDPDAIDYSKCLEGTNNNMDENVSTQQSETVSNRVITYSTFMEVVG